MSSVLTISLIDDFAFDEEPYNRYTHPHPQSTLSEAEREREPFGSNYELKFGFGACLGLPVLIGKTIFSRKYLMLLK